MTLFQLEQGWKVRLKKHTQGWHTIQVWEDNNLILSNILNLQSLHLIRYKNDPTKSSITFSSLEGKEFQLDPANINYMLLFKWWLEVNQEKLLEV